MSTQIYKATYSSVPVYEMPCQGVAVMRRKSDGWLNATQILKVAGFDKPQRTRVLEREVQKGTHEKVQGGYGKYQGTWVPMDRGIALSRQYGVDRLLQPIFDYLPTADSPPLAPKHITALPARPKKKNEVQTDSDVPPNMLAAGNKSKVAANKAAARKKLLEARRQAAAEERAAREESEEESLVRAAVGSDGRSVSPTPSDASESDDTPSPLGSEVDVAWSENGTGGPRKRKHPDSATASSHNRNTSAHAQLGIGPLRYARMILDYFVSESTQVPQFLVSPPADFDANVVIDDDGHTALHWACAMGRIRIVRLLLTAGADIFRANSMGQTALMRSVMFTNNYDLRKFPELFELLHRSTINIDRNDRTVFHYIVDIALQKGKTHAARYYIETVLARLVDYPKEVADILNFQDEEGETALTLAARARSKRLVKILLDNGADPKISNRDGKSAEDYILEDERFRETDLIAGAPIPTLLPAAAAGVNAILAGAPYFAPRLHTSQVAQKTSSSCVPEVVDLLETLAYSFDAELEEKDRDIAQAHTLLANIQAETIESQRSVQQLQHQASGLGMLEARELSLLDELESKMGKRFRLGWEKWVRDEDQREQKYEETNARGQADLDHYRELVRNPPADTAAQAQALRAKIEQVKVQRKSLFKLFAQKQSDQGTGIKMEQYRQLISLGSGVPLDQVDGVIESLCEGVMDE